MADTEITIRRAVRSDVEPMLDLRATVAAEGVWIGAEAPLDLDRDRTAHEVTIDEMAAGGHALALVAVTSGGDVVGTLSIGVRIRGIGDLALALAPEARSRGVGRRLMTEAIEWAGGTGLHKLALQHWVWNQRAHRLYESVGFVEEGYLRRHYRRNDGSLWDAVIMGLVLDQDAPGHPARADEPPGGWPR